MSGRIEGSHNGQIVLSIMTEHGIIRIASSWEGPEDVLLQSEGDEARKKYQCNLHSA